MWRRKEWDLSFVYMRRKLCREVVRWYTNALYLVVAAYKSYLNWIEDSDKASELTPRRIHLAKKGEERVEFIWSLP